MTWGWTPCFSFYDCTTCATAHGGGSCGWCPTTQRCEHRDSAALCDGTPLLQQKRDSILARQKRGSLWSRQPAADNALPPIAYVRPGGQLTSVVNRAKLAAAAADESKAEPRRKLSRRATERQISLNDIAYGDDPSALIGAIPTAAAAAAGNPARAPKKAKGRPAQDRLPAIGDRRGRSAAA